MVFLLAELIPPNQPASPPVDMYDLVLAHGRCVDPESGLDGVRHVCIAGDKIKAIVEPAADGTVPEGRRSVDCAGLVVAPGFIDLHSHGAGHIQSAEIQAQDGVTFHGELEFGVCGDVSEWYATREARGAVIHFGCSAGHIPNRVAVMTAPAEEDHDVEEAATEQNNKRRRTSEGGKHGRCGAKHAAHTKDPHLLSTCFCTSNASHHRPCTKGQVRRICAAMRQGIASGALGLGLGIQYTCAADHEEVYRLFKLGASLRPNPAPLFIHSRGIFKDLTDFHELFADAAASGAPLHICHLNSSAAPLNVALILEMLDDLNRRGAADVTTEAYPYTAGMTRLDSGVFEPGWEGRLKIGPGDLEWIETGERLTAENFAERRAAGGLVAVHSIPASVVDLILLNPRVMVASDAIPFTKEGKGHPRSSGSFCRVLGHFVRDRGVLSLAQALSKMALMPARRLEAICPAFAAKGRLRVGADADVVAFDLATVADRATFADPMQPSIGMRHVLVAGTAVVSDGALTAARPGCGYKSTFDADALETPPPPLPPC